MNPTTMPGAWVRSDGTLEIRDLPRPQAGPDTLLVRTLASALCGSDLHRFRGAESYGLDTDVFGHESVVEVVDPAGSAFVLGQRLLHVPFPEDGRVFAPFQAARPGNLVPLPDDLSDEIAVMAQQLGTVLHALKAFWPRLEPPVSAFIAGAGPAGLLFVQVLRLIGCPRVVVAEPSEHRRRLAASLGAEVDSDWTGIDLCVDAVGEPDARRECLRRVRVGGTMGVFGLPDREPGDLGFSALDLLRQQLTVVGATGAQWAPGLAPFHEAVRLLAERQVDVAPLISDRVGLAELPAACLRAAYPRDQVVKVLAVFPGPEGDG
ncbi:MAG: zinc-binding dehydrogenase [Nocardioidaceae bacterium]